MTSAKMPTARMESTNKKEFTREIALPAGVTMEIAGGKVLAKGPLGETSKALQSKRVYFKVDGERVVLRTHGVSKNDKKMINTFTAHVKNLVRGVTKGYTYTLKICSEHFPMNVTVSGKEFVVKNFLGEHYPRKITLPASVKVEISGNDVLLKSNDKEAAGQLAGSIEKLTRRGGFDRRIFQDGIFITGKPGKEFD